MYVAACSTPNMGEMLVRHVVVLVFGNDSAERFQPLTCLSENPHTHTYTQPSATMSSQSNDKSAEMAQEFGMTQEVRRSCYTVALGAVIFAYVAPPDRPTRI